MNGRGNMTPSNTQYPSDGGKRTGASPSSRRPPLSPHSQIPLARLPAGSPYFSTGPWTPMTPPPVFSSLGTSWSSSSFRDSVPPVNPPRSSPSSFCHGSVPPMGPSLSSFRRDSPSAPMEKNSSLPPRVPSTRRQYSAGSKTLPSESIYPALPELLVGQQRCNNIGVAMEKHCTTEFSNLDNNTGDEEMIDVSDWEGTKTTARERRRFSIGSSSSVGVKRRAGKETEPLRKHYRSVSMDAGCFTETLNQPPLLRSLPGSSSSVDGNKTASSRCEYTEHDLKIIAATDPKRAKKIESNRASAKRSNDKKAKYLLELQNKFEYLKNHTTLLSSKVEHLKNNEKILMDEQRELKMRIKSMEQHEKLREAFTEQLLAELQLLKTQHMSIQNRGQFDRTNMESLDPNMFQQQLNINQINQPQQQLNIDQFNQPQQQQLNINQFNEPPQMNSDFYGQDYGH